MRNHKKLDIAYIILFKYILPSILIKLLK
jgi:hypothetical protein